MSEQGLLTLSGLGQKWTCSVESGVVVISGYKGDAVRETIPHHLKDGTPIKYVILKSSKTANERYRKLQEVVIEADLVKCEAFLGNQYIKRVIITGAMKEMPCFQESRNLEFVKLPDTVTEIVQNGFWGCCSLQSVEMPQFVTEIGENAFLGCANLESIHIPESVTEVGENAFVGCRKLVDESGFFVLKQILYVYYGSHDAVKIPDSVELIGATAFLGSKNLVSVEIPNSVTEIGNHVFLGCKSLRSIHIPDSVKIIRESAFANCTSLRIITGGENLTKECEKFFEQTTHLDWISPYVFKLLKMQQQSDWMAEMLKGWDDCTAEKKAYLLQFIQGKKKLREMLFCSTLIDGISDFLKKSDKLKLDELNEYIEYAIAEGRTEITAMLLDYKENRYDRTKMEARTEHQELLEMGFVLPNLTEFSKTWTCAKKDGAVIISKYKGKSQRETIPHHLKDGTPIERLVVKTFKYEGKSYEGLEELVIEADLKECDIFSYQRSIKTLIFRGKLEKMPCFRSRHLETVILPSSVTAIVDHAFYGCSALQSLEIPDSVTEIGCMAFADCSSLVSMEIPSAVTKIAGWAFQRCKALQSVYVPDSVIEIGRNAFEQCEQLTIRGKSGSYVESYCEMSEIPFRAVD